MQDKPDITFLACLQPTTFLYLLLIYLSIQYPSIYSWYRLLSCWPRRIGPIAREFICLFVALFEAISW